jgi:signal transduction histidine kinase
MSDNALNQPPQQQDRQPPRTLLVVDDEMGPRQSLNMVFKDEYKVLMADGGEQALEIIKDHVVHSAVLDIRMNGMSGVELLGELKKHDPNIEVIMLTAYETIDTARQALKHGACDYLTKPFDLDTIRSAVGNAMDRRTLSDQREANLHRLRDVQQELNHQRVEEEIIRTKGEIYASVLHDINGPLTVISGFVDLINNRLEGASSLEGQGLDLIKDRLTRVNRQVNNCIEISQRYLNFLRNPSQGASASLIQTLHDIHELLKVHPSLEANKLHVQLPNPDIQAQVNGGNLMQLILNLGINALQSSREPHEVFISTRFISDPLPLQDMPDTDSQHVINREGLNNSGPLAAIEVRDTGDGITPDVLKNIFEARANGTYFSTKTDSGGTGLGMAIISRFIRDAEGILHLQTQPGSGTSMTVYLPAQK